MMRSGAIKGAGPFFSGREPHVPAIQSYPTPKQIYLHVTPPTGNSEEATKWTIWKPTKDLKDNEQIDDYTAWEYPGDDDTGVDVNFDIKTKLVVQIACSSHANMKCPTMLGIHDGMNETSIIERLGKPSHEEIQGVVKEIAYEHIG